MLYINGCSWTDSFIFRDSLSNNDILVINNAASGNSNFQICRQTKYDLKNFSKHFDKITAIIFLTEAFRSEYEYKMAKGPGSLQDLASKSLHQMKKAIDSSLPNNVNIIYSSSFVDLPWETNFPSMLTLACKAHGIIQEETQCYTTKVIKVQKIHELKPNLKDLDIIIDRLNTIEKIPNQQNYHIKDSISYTAVVKQIQEVLNG
jgi:hypothetical protein